MSEFLIEDKVDETILKGWATKRFQKFWPFRVFENKYLILQGDALRYYRKYPSKNFKEISLNDLSILNSSNPLELRVSNGKKKIQFRFASVTESLNWSNALSSSKINYEVRKEINTRNPRNSFIKLSNDRPLLNEMISKFSSHESIFEEIEFYFKKSDQSAYYTANFFFDKIHGLPPNERKEISKEMARAISIWTDNFDSNGSESIESNAIFSAWATVALTRELKSSCKYIDLDSNSAENNLQENLKKMPSRRQSLQKRGSIIMPFRSDSPETLFISSIIHHASRRDDFLRNLLKVELDPVFHNPNKFTYPKKSLFDMQQSQEASNQEKKKKFFPSLYKRLDSKLDPLPTPSFEDLRDSVRDDITNVCKDILANMQKVNLPPKVVIILEIVKKITIENLEDGSKYAGSLEDFHYGTYFTCCTALLFLRLICRAIISPEEYGIINKSKISITAPTPSKIFPFCAISLLKYIDQKGSYDASSAEPQLDGDSSSTELNSFYLNIQKSLRSLDLELSSEKVNEFLNFLIIEDRGAYQTLNENSADTYLNVPSYDTNNDNIQINTINHSWALAEVAKFIQQVANISCINNDEMMEFTSDTIKRQNVIYGIISKDQMDSYLLSQNELIHAQVQISMAKSIKSIYRNIGNIENDW